jgi:hypothetical protein
MCGAVSPAAGLGGGLRYPTSRKKRARCGAPGVGGEDRAQKAPVGRSPEMTRLGGPVRSAAGFRGSLRFHPPIGGGEYKGRGKTGG